jgi:RND superfamily putative drug exporter
MMSEEDFSRTVVLMLSGIAIILFFMLRSLVMPIYLIVSLVLTYYTAAAITELIFVNILGYAGIGWAVPFFAFVILIALGIDYSIFLMDRFNEWKDRPGKRSNVIIHGKMERMIIFAATIWWNFILSDASRGIIAIGDCHQYWCSLYAFLSYLPLFIPVMVVTFGNANCSALKIRNKAVKYF